MTVRLGNYLSEKRNVNAGAPQGSVLGTYVFNTATEDLEEGAETDQEQEQPDVDLTFLETAADLNHAASTPSRTTAANITCNESPIQTERHDIVILPTTRNVPPKLRKRIEPSWRSKELCVKKFVDDNVQIEKIKMQPQETFRQVETLFKNPRVVRSELMFKHIVKNANSKGLLVNSKKTNLLVISASKSYDAQAHFYDNERQRVDCTKEMKALGFIFNSKGDVSSQVEKLCSKLRQKIWALRHLRKSGFTERELLRMYTSYIRPSIEYSSPIYHPMLTGEQETLIERQQFFALKNIYGFEYSHRKLLELANIETLKQRRIKATVKFATKAAANPRFQSWFPRRRKRGRNNEAEEYVEMKARTDRRRNSPLFYYRRILNEHRIDYDVRKKQDCQHYPAPT